MILFMKSKLKTIITSILFILAFVFINITSKWFWDLPFLSLMLVLSGLVLASISNGEAEQD